MRLPLAVTREWAVVISAFIGLVGIMAMIGAMLITETAPGCR
jgi:hypothetical protein